MIHTFNRKKIQLTIWKRGLQTITRVGSYIVTQFHSLLHMAKYGPYTSLPTNHDHEIPSSNKNSPEKWSPENQKKRNTIFKWWRFNNLTDNLKFNIRNYRWENFINSLPITTKSTLSYPITSFLKLYD